MRYSIFLLLLLFGTRFVVFFRLRNLTYYKKWPFSYLGLYLVIHEFFRKTKTELKSLTNFAPFISSNRCCISGNPYNSSQFETVYILKKIKKLFRKLLPSLVNLWSINYMNERNCLLLVDEFHYHNIDK